MNDNATLAIFNRDYSTVKSGHIYRFCGNSNIFKNYGVEDSRKKAHKKFENYLSNRLIDERFDKYFN